MAVNFDRARKKATELYGGKSAEKDEEERKELSTPVKTAATNSGKVDFDAARKKAQAKYGADTGTGVDNTPATSKENAVDKAKDNSVSLWDRLKEAAEFATDHVYGNSTPANTQTTDDPRKANLLDLTLGSVKRGYVGSRKGQEAYKAMMGKENELEEYTQKLSGSEYNFQPEGLIGTAVSGAAELLGQQVRQWTDPRSLSAAGGAAAMASVAGKAGPQALIPEEIMTVPAMFGIGMKAGSSLSNFEIEAGNAYLEMLENGISEDTAKKIALVVGGGNAALEGLQLDELFKSMKVLQKSGADETVLNRIMRVLIDRGFDVTNETFQETAQEGVTIAGNQAASKLEKGDWQYDRSEVANRLGETALSSALSFGLMNIPGGVRGINAAVQDGKRNTTQEGPQMAQEAPVQAEPAAQEDSTMALLRQAAMEMQENGSVSSRTADRIMGDSAAMEELGVESTASKSQQRRAVKNAVESYAQRDGQDVLRQAATEMQEDAEGTAEGGAQDILRQAAMEMQEEQAQPAPRQDNIREQLRSAARDMGENGTKALAESYDGSADAAEYYAGFAHYYKAGVRGSDMAQVNSQYADSLTEGQKLAAFSAGQNDAAASLAREERAAQYARVAGEDSGLVFDDYVFNKLEPAEADRINWVAKRLGLRVRFVPEDSITDEAGHTANAQIRGKEVLVEQNNRNPELFLVGHEITHRMQELAPKEYRDLRNFVAQKADVQEDAERKQRLYQGTYEEALDEATADYVGRMLDETTLLDEFIEQHKNDRTLLEKLRDAFRAVVAKLTGAEKKAAQTAEGKLTAALEAAGKQAEKLGENKNTAQEGGETKHSIKETQDGKKYVQADRQVIFGNDPESWSYQLEDYINGKIRNGEDVQLIAQDGDVLTLTATSAGKLSDYHTSDGRTMSEQAYERKVNAAAHIDELATISRRGKKNVVDYNQRHGEMAADGWNYRTAFFRDFDGKYYEVAISVAESADGKVVYNIGQMQERSTPQINGSSAVNSGAQRGNASTHSISGESKDVNTKSSLKEDNLLLPLNDESIEEKKKNLDWDTANRMLDEQEGLSYRFYGNDNPMSRAGYAMFSDDPDQNGSNYGGDNPRAFSVSKEDLTDFSDVQDKLIDARHKTDEAAPWELEDYTSLDDSEFAELFDPDDIVDNAAAWDNEDLVEWFWNNVAEPNEIRGVKTFDGAIAFDPEIIKRNLPAEVTFTQQRFSLKESVEEKLNQVGVEYDDETKSVNATRYSLKTWNESSYVQDRDNAAKAMSEAIGISQKKAKAYIDSVNGIARIIADGRVRLDYEPAPGKSAFVSNAEYGESIDFSTICKKRRLFTGTFEAIQAALPDTALTAEEFLEIRSMMAEKGYEVSCGLCYVEGSRANMGQYTKQFLERYAATNPDYLPNMAEMNTATGQEKIRREHPEVYEAYEYFMNHYGRLKPTDKALFASQQKPKMYQLSTEYKGEILTKFGKKGAKVEEKNANGGLRLQSFSYFEIVHLIDSMQVIMDMSRVGLAGQAYTKVPDFAWALGDTGLKINLSLIAKGVDSKGKLILDEVEGMAEADAMALRERYSDNVGTILVIFNDQQLLAAMADERIDFIIPFHRSQWKSDQYEAMGLPKNPKDYTPWQNESYLEPVYNKNGKKLRPDNYMPNNYWNFRESGKKNAEAYLKMCAENNRLPKFSYLLDKKTDGSYALKKDGSTDGYWKLLIDFKMYNNDGKGVPQKPVVPEFNMEQAERMLQEYNGGHQKFPAAQDVVDEFVAKYKEKNDYASDPGAKFSRKEGTFGPRELVLSVDSDFQKLIDSVERQGKKEGLSDAEIRKNVNDLVSRTYRDLVDENGFIKRGEKPTRDGQTPKKDRKGRKVSMTVRTILEAGVTPDEIIPDIKKLTAGGVFSYDTYTDKQAIADARKKIAGSDGIGWDAAQRKWFKDVERGDVSKENTAMGWTLYDNAANSGDTKLALDILNQMVEHQRSAAQALQASRILKKLSPETQLYQVQRSVKNLQKELNQRYGDKKGPKLKIDQELAEEFLQAKDQTARDEALKEIYRDIGRQMPTRFTDRWNAWRYMAMLGNTRTHMRNILGNAGFAPVVGTKDLAATVIESAVDRVSGGKLGRSKALVGAGKNDRALLRAAWVDYAQVQETAMSGGKYSDFANANKYVEEGRKIFGNTRSKVWNQTVGKGLETFRKSNGAALDAEDVWFSKPHYAYALAQYCKANNIPAEQIATGKGLEKAREYAVSEAQKATYRDTNYLSQTISELGRVSRNEKNPVKKGVGLAMEGILPFRKTPANILARGLEYSPIGLMQGIKQAAVDVQKGEITGAQAIDRISAGLTGTGLLVLGVYLASQGLLRGHGGDDDEKKEFEELMGHQSYSLEVGDTSVTLDWLAPECLPLFIGVNLWEETGNGKENLTLSDALNAAATVTEPMLEMSCLQSLNDIFDAVGYAYSDGLDGLPAAVASAATSYLTQALPTVGGQLERTGEDKRYTTYTEKNGFLTSDMQYTLGKASGKIPGWDYQQIPYVDAWGRTESTGSAGERAFNNMVNPSYTSRIESSKAEEELLRVYGTTGDDGVFPERAKKYITVVKKQKDPKTGKEVESTDRKYLTGEEYVKYATKKGQKSLELVEALTGSASYRSMNDEDKAEAIKDVYTLADQAAKSEIGKINMSSWVEKALDARKRYGIKEATYVDLRLRTNDIKSLKDSNGETIDNSKSLLIMEQVYNTPGLTDTQRQAMFEYLGVGKSVRHYNKALVQEKLSSMRKTKKG